MPLISVLIPCHNAAPWLQAAIDSVRVQTHRNLEIIVYDDGSTDNSGEIIRKAVGEDGRVVVMGEPTNCGIVHALNTMLEAARGDYIARMDADDICLPQRFARQVEFLKQTDCDLCGSWFIEFGQGLSRTTRWPHTEAAVQAALLFQNSLCHPTVMARREVFERFRYREDYRLAEDYDLFTRVASEFHIANVPEPLLRYRRHKQQATQASRKPMEEITQSIRLQALQARGIEASPREKQLHNMIRAPASIHAVGDLLGIESWLLKLLGNFEHPDARRVIATQWTRAAIRAAPMGWEMWRVYRRSPLHALLAKSIASDADLAALAGMRLDYTSRPFHLLRRLGLSA